MMRAVVCVIALAGCIEPELVECRNGIACAPGLVCDEPHKTCVTPERATVCRSKPENELCLDGGACHHGICVPIECGNWLRDPMEMCDDGNLLSGDGCSADCTTNETCGNGVIDPARGETCDEGDLASHDGCDSQCRTEELGFTELVQTSGIARQFAAYAYDDARQKLVLFGGLDSADLRTSATLELDATTHTFSVRTPQIAPTARYGAAAAYDAKHHVVVLFGGTDPSGAVADTWTWDGEAWHVTTPTTAPPARLYTGITYDSRRDRVLLFGGRGVQGALDDLWSWDGTTWTELHPPTRPPMRERMMFAYDPAHDRVVLFGGIASGVLLSDMWLFDGDDWEQISPASLPTPRFGGTLTFDGAHGGLIMTGGAANAPTQLWDGTQWTILGTNASPVASRVHHIAYFDAAANVTVAGLGIINGVYQTDLHRLAGDTWSAIAQTIAPAAFDDAAMAYDSRRGRMVMFGGSSTAGLSQQTWEHDGTAWTQITPMAPPSARALMSMAYDEARGKIVMFGGNSSDPAVYEWDGLAWTSIVAAGPVPRARVEMTYDAASATTVMFGGDSSGTRFGDTWQWDGTAWTEWTSSPSPEPRIQHALAYDRARGEVVLFGGADVNSARLGDTWTWTATTGWVEKHPLASPSPRVRHVMVYDPIREEVVLFGGAVGGGALGDVWSWDGTNWKRSFANDPPAPFGDGTAAYDNARRHVLIHGALGTLRLQWRGLAADEACRTAIDRDGDHLRGCADPDCAAYCTPLCPQGSLLCPGPSCGDSMCSPLESCRLCDRDCGFCTARCGDDYCDGGEMCSGECPS